MDLARVRGGVALDAGEHPLANRFSVVPVFAILLAAIGIALSSPPALAAAPPGTYFQGFERDTSGWFPGGDRGIVRKPSGYVNGGYASGVPSASGRWHARLPETHPLTPCVRSCDGPFTRWGGYSATFPPGGYLTQLDIYMDVAWAGTHPDTRFDWISAINNNTGGFLRDFVFNVGTTPTGFIVQSSTNSTRSGANPYVPCPSPSTPPNVCRPPATISASGWYTFRHTFRDSAGTLAIDFDILRQDTGTPTAHWTIFADPMSAVGGNRYGWFSNEEIPDLAIDNALRTGLCRQGDGNGDADNASGKSHFHFHKNACDQRNEGATEDDGPNHFESRSVTAATFTYNEDSQTMTMVGTGLDNGLPVGFTLIAIDNNGLLPSVFTLTLTSGRVITGPVIGGTLQVQ
jgi:hypothetical protein